MKKQLGQLDRMYACSDCGKLTRDTGRGEASAEMCATCYDAAETYNLVQDGEMEDEEFQAYLKKIKYAGSEF